MTHRKTIFTTARLEIRALTLEDWPEFLNLNSSSEGLSSKELEPRKSSPYNKKDFERIILYYGLRTGKGVWGVSLLTSPGLIGAASLGEARGREELQIGYRLHKEYWGQGYGTEIAMGLVQYGTENLKLLQMGATTHPKNEASKNILRKSGFSFKGLVESEGKPMYYFIWKNHLQDPELGL